MNWASDRLAAFMMGMLFGVVGTVFLWALFTLPAGGM